MAGATEDGELVCMDERMAIKKSDPTNPFMASPAASACPSANTSSPKRGWNGPERVVKRKHRTPEVDELDQDNDPALSPTRMYFMIHSVKLI